MPLRPPSYRRHKTGQATVRIKGKDHYLGKHGSERSKDRYKQLISELWEPRWQHQDWPSNEELMARYLLHARQYYADSNEVDHIRLAMKHIPAERLVI